MSDNNIIGYKTIKELKIFCLGFSYVCFREPWVIAGLYFSFYSHEIN